MGRNREALLGAAVGMKGIGKSEQTLKQILRYVRGNPANRVPPQKFLIADVNDEYGHFELRSSKNTIIKIPALAFEEVERFTNQTVPEVRRLRFFKEGNVPMTLDEVADKIFEVLTVYKDGGLLIEDITKFIGDHYPKDIVGAICTQRHRSVDIIIHFQTVGKLTNPKIWGNLNWIRLHKATDRFERYKDKFAEYIEMLKIAETLVDTEYNNGNERFFSWIDLNAHEVKGQFNSTQFVNAIDEYISVNHNRVMRDLLNKRDHRGKKLYTHETAAREKRQQLYDDYYGNEH